MSNKNTYKVGITKTKAELTLEQIKKHIPVWTANKIVVDDISKEVEKFVAVEGFTNHMSKEVKVANVFIDSSKNSVIGITSNCGTVISNSTKTSLVEGGEGMYVGGVGYRLSDKEDIGSTDIEVTDVFGTKEKIPHWVFLEYLSPEETKNIVIDNIPFSKKNEAEGKEVYEKLVKKFGDKEFVRIRKEDVFDGYNIIITRMKADEIPKIMKGNSSDWIETQKCKKLKSISFNISKKHGVNFNWAVVDQKIFTLEENLYKHLIENQYDSLESYFSDIKEEMTEGHNHFGMSDKVYNELLEQGFSADSIKISSHKEHLQMMLHHKVDEKKYKPGDVIFNKEAQNLIIVSELSPILSDASALDDVKKSISLYKENSKFLTKFNALLKNNNIELQKINLNKIMDLNSKFEPGLYSLGSFLILADAEGKIVSFCTLTSLHDNLLQYQVFEKEVTALADYFKKTGTKSDNKVATENVVAAAVSAAAIKTALSEQPQTTETVIENKAAQIIKSDAKEVAKRIAVNKIVHLTAELVVKQLNTTKKSSKTTETIKEFLKSSKGRSMVSITAGTILPTIKSTLDSKYHPLIDEFSKELRVSGETELATEFLDLVIDSASVLSSSVLGDFFVAEKVRVEAAEEYIKKLPAPSRSEVFAETTKNEEKILINGN